MTFRQPLLVVLVLLLLPLSALAADQASVLSADGAILQVRLDTYGTLFPGAAETEPDNAVLALDITHPDGAFERWLVPATESRRAEVAPALFYDQAARTAYLLWEGYQSVVHSQLYLISFDDAGWGPLIEITNSPFANKGHPQLEVTRDAGRPEDGQPTTRTTFHLTWWEEWSGGSHKCYAPIVVENGRPKDTNPVFYLSELLERDDEPTLREETELMRLQPGSDHRSVVIGFQTVTGDRVATVSVEVLPDALRGLADVARHQIIAIGLMADNRGLLADDVYQTLLEQGTGFHEAGRLYLAEQTHSVILEAPTSITVPALAEKARHQIIAIGAHLSANGLQGSDDFQILEIPRQDEPDSHHLLKVTALSMRPTPAVGKDATMYLSGKGDDVLIAWNVNGAVRYRESVGDGWSPIQEIALSEAVSADDAHRLLADRIHDR